MNRSCCPEDTPADPCGVRRPPLDPLLTCERWSRAGLAEKSKVVFVGDTILEINSRKVREWTLAQVSPPHSAPPPHHHTGTT